MSPEPRDELDRTLAAGLAGLATSPDDPDDVLASMQPRLRRARIRHRIARASVVAVAIVGVASVAAVAVGSRDNSNRITVEGSNTTPSVAASSTTLPKTSTTLRRPPTPSTTITTPPQGTVGPDLTVPGGGPPVGPGPTTPTTGAQSQPRTFSSRGGTLTVQFAGGRLTLVSYQAANGYAAEVHRNEPDDVEVRFEGPDDASIRIRVENGRVRPEIND